MPDKAARPFPVQLEVELLDRLSEPVREGRAKSVSAIIRTALERYDFANVVVVHPAQLLISVRLSPEIRRNLKQISRTKHTSVGQLVRAAVEAYLPQLETGAVNQLEMPIAHEPKVSESVLKPRRRGARKTRAKAGGKKSVKTREEAVSDPFVVGRALCPTSYRHPSGINPDLQNPSQLSGVGRFDNVTVPPMTSSTPTVGLRSLPPAF